MKRFRCLKCGRILRKVFGYSQWGNTMAGYHIPTAQTTLFWHCPTCHINYCLRYYKVPPLGEDEKA